MKKSKFLALLGAGVLTLGVAGTALAATPPSDADVTPTYHDGNITLTGEGNNDSPDCAVFDGLETGNTGGSGTTGSGVEITWTYDSETKEFGFSAEGGLVTHAYIKGGNGYNDYDYTGETDGGIAADGGLFAPDTNGDGNPQGLSHAVFCTTGGENPPPSPSFEGSQEGETDAPSEPSTDTFGGNGTSGPADGAWLLVVALGVLLASIVVLTPARAKSRR